MLFLVNSMDTLLLLAIFIPCLIVFIKSLVRYDEIFQFPFLMTCDLLFFLGPQLYYISKHPDLLKPYGQGALTLFILSCLLFYVAALLGYNSNSAGSRFPVWKYDRTKMIIGLIILTLIGQYGKIKLAALSTELTDSTQWSGLPVRYLFFRNVGTLCVPLGIILYYMYKSKIVLGILLVQITATLSTIVLSGKRSPVVFLGLTILTGLWFVKRYKVSRKIIVIGGIVFFMFVMNIGTYRALVNVDGERDWRTIISEVFDIKKTIAKFSDGTDEKDSEYVDAMNGVVAASAIYETGQYDYGLVAWNVAIHRWIPGQLVGYGIKNALKFDRPSAGEVAKQLYGYKMPRGTCTPGYTQIFASFSFFGVFFTFFMGRAARSIWEQALEGNLIAQILHFALAPIYLRFGGGGIWALLGGVFFWVIFLLPMLCWAKGSEASFRREIIPEAPPVK